MRKRIRKKKHLKDFKEYGCEVQIKFDSATNFGDFLKDYNCHAIENNNMTCLVSGGIDDFDSYIFLGRRNEYHDNYTALRDWLEKHPSVVNLTLSPAVDAWHEQNN